MLQRTSALFVAAAVVAGLAAIGSAGAQQQRPEPAATGTMINTEGTEIGSVDLNQFVNGLQIVAAAENLPEGVHAFHIHQTGTCEPPSFESAGGHFNPTDKSHGFQDEQGPHAGDLPNVYVGADGVLAVEYITDRMSLTEGETAVLDDDGAALVIHQGADDYTTDPAGNAGPRLACAVIQPAQQ